MTKQKDDQDRPEVTSAEPNVAVAAPAVESAPEAPTHGVGEGLLQDLLPEISAIARKVGGFKKLAEIATELDRGYTIE
jgi:hypothetical protein